MMVVWRCPRGKRDLERPLMMVVWRCQRGKRRPWEATDDSRVAVSAWKRETLRGPSLTLWLDFERLALSKGCGV
jgi:hypothetical protein